MNLHYRENIKEIINYNIYVYNPQDDFELKPLEEKIEIMLRVWFPECFSNARLDDVLPTNELIYLSINYHLKGIIMFLVYLIQTVYEEYLPFFEQFIEILNSIIYPVSMVYFPTNIRNSLMDLFIDYNNFEVSNFNFCLGGALLAFANFVILNHSFFLTCSNLFNDFSFFGYYYEKEIEQLVSYIEPEEIEEVVIVPEIYLDGKWDNLRALIRWTKSKGIEFLEFIKKEKDRRQVIEYSHIFCGVVLETTIDLLSNIKQGNNLSMQNLLINVFSDNNYCSDTSLYRFRDEYAYLLTYDSYEFKLLETDEYLFSLFEIEIDTTKLYKSLILSYFIYRYAYSFLRNFHLFTIKTIVKILIYLEKLNCLFIFKKDPKKTLTRFDKGYPSKNKDIAPKVFTEKSKKPLLNFLKVEYTREEYYKRRELNYILYNLLINKLTTLFYYMCIKFVNKTIIFGYLDLVGYCIGKMIKIYYYDTFFVNLLIKGSKIFYSKLTKILIKRNWIKKKKKYKLIKSETVIKEKKKSKKI
jgi:hypothetical protein